MLRFNLLTLRSSLSLPDQQLDQEREEFLAALGGGLSFDGGPSDPAVFFVQTGGSEAVFQSIYRDYKEPYCLLVQGRRNSLAAALEIKTFLSKQGLSSIVLQGEPSSMRKKLKEFGKNYLAASKLSRMKLGVIGKPSDWLIGSEVDYAEAKKRLGVEIVDVDIQELLDGVAKAKEPEEDLVARFAGKTSRLDDLTLALKVYGALKDICSRHELDGFTLRCFDLLTSLKTTSCIAFGLLLDEGILAACEGDVPALLTMALAYARTERPAFMANPAFLDVEKKTAIYAHCACPFSLGPSFSLNTHFESGIAFGVKVEVKEEEVTLAKISPSLGELRLLEGKIKRNLHRDDLCRTQIEVKFDDSIGELLDNPYGNHGIFLLGEHKKELFSFFQYLKLIVD